MNQHKLPQVMAGVTLVVLFLVGCGAPVTTPTPIVIVERFTQDNGLEIPSVSETTGEGVISFEAGDSPSMLKFILNGTLPVSVENFCGFFCPQVCSACMSTIRIAPGLKIPMELFGGQESAIYKLGDFSCDSVSTSLNKGIVKSITYRSCIGKYSVTANGKTIVSGKEGVTLRKEGRRFFLVEGSAYLSQ